MTTEREATRIVRSWLQADDHGSAERVLAVVLYGLDSRPQRRPLWRKFGVSFASASVKFVAAALTLLAVAGLGLALYFSRPAVTPIPTATPSPTPVVSPTTSPDPTASQAPVGLVAYTVRRVLPIDDHISGVYTRIEIAGADGSKRRDLVPDPSEVEGTPVRQDIVGWMPDGSGLLYQEGRGGDATVDLILTAPDGATSRVICDGAIGDCPSTERADDIAISPDGQELAFAGDAGLSVLDISTGQVVHVPVVAAGGLKPRNSSASEYWSEPSWSPDGARLAVVTGYWSLQGAFDQVVVLVSSVDGSDPHAIDPFADGSIEGQLLSPSWSPDGSKIVFGAITGTWDRLYAARPDGSGLEPLTEPGTSGYPRWTDDGRIVFRRPAQDGFEGWLMNADGTAAVRISARTLRELTELGCRVCPYSEAALAFNAEVIGDAYWQPIP